MNYILKESLDGTSFLLRQDLDGRIIRNKRTKKPFDVGDEIILLEGVNTLGDICKDVWLCSDLSKLIEKGKELSRLYGLELKISRWITDKNGKLISSMVIGELYGKY